MTSPGVSLRLQLHQVCLEVATDIPDFAVALAQRLPPFDAPCSSKRIDRRYRLERRRESAPGFTLSRGTRRAVPVHDAEQAADLLVEDAERFLAQRAPNLIFVHAGAVVWRGKAILLPGRSQTGKSELVAALLRAGAEYLSDEFGPLDAAGCVHPYARPLALRRERGIERVTPETLGSRPATQTPLGAIAFLRYRAQASWSCSKISAGQSLLKLLANTVAARRRFDQTRSVLGPLAATAFSVAGTRGPADEAARLLLRDIEQQERL